MSITALLWALLYCGSILLAFSNPLFASLGYLLEYYMRPDLKWWGDDLPVLRYNLIISLTLGMTFLLRRSSLREMPEIRNPILPWLLCLLGIMLAVTLTFAVDTMVSWQWMVQWTKIAIIFPLLVIGVVRDRKGFNLFMIVSILGAFWWGWESYLDPSREAGRLKSVGSGDSADDNGAAAHLVTVLPLAATYALVERDWRLRLPALIAIPFIVNTIILCNSRGSTVGMGVALLAALFLIKRGKRLRFAGAGAAMVLVVFLMADEQFISRQQTTANYEEDNSARQRLVTWQGAAELVKDHPLGTGGRGFHLLSPIYIPEIVAAHGGDRRAPHNTWVMAASEWGIAGFICYVGIYLTTLLTLEKVKRRASTDDQSFYYWRAFSMQMGLIAFLTASTFTDRFYAEAGYWLVALTFALYRIQVADAMEAREVPDWVPARQAARSAPFITAASRP